jgi:hypothetical protein
MNNPYLSEATPYLDARFIWHPSSIDWRKTFVKKYAWAIPSEEAIAVIKRHVQKIIEIGAGTGYWAYVLAQVGIDVVAYDLQPFHNHWSDERWFDVLQGSERLSKQYSDRALMLCWPPYADPMATDALQVYEGNTLIYIGEDEGGCTADNEFHRLIGASYWDSESDQMVKPQSEWTLAEWVNLPQWQGIHDNLYIYTRTSNAKI